LVVDGGLVRLPGDRPLEIDLGVPAGVTYACAAETMILAHRLADPRVSRGGRLDPLFVQELRDAGARLGFALHLPAATAATHG
jgi:predicted amino acid dehydrogenase